jgi:hypothetical protein
MHVVASEHPVCGERDVRCFGILGKASLWPDEEVRKEKYGAMNSKGIFRECRAKRQEPILSIYSNWRHHFTSRFRDRDVSNRESRWTVEKVWQLTT